MGETQIQVLAAKLREDNTKFGMNCDGSHRGNRHQFQITLFWFDEESQRAKSVLISHNRPWSATVERLTSAFTGTLQAFTGKLDFRSK